jgi:deoxyribonuclease-4
MQSLQIFTAVPKFYNEKMGVKPERVRAFHEALAQAGIAPEHVIVHAGYVLNCATPDDTKWERAALALAKELERSSVLGVAGVCFHPGAATTGTREQAMARVTEAMRRALEAVPEGSTRLLIENTAGAGTTVGRTPEEIGTMLGALPPALRTRAGYGLDTCHLYASGYDIAHSPERQREILDAFEAAVGERPAFFHCNDSEGALGSNRDRHARVGEGAIGIAPFGWLLRDVRAQGIPCILETPQAVEEPPEDDDRADAWEAADIARLRAL